MNVNVLWSCVNMYAHILIRIHCGTNLDLENISTGRIPDGESLLSNPTSPEAEAQGGKWLAEGLCLRGQSVWAAVVWLSLSLVA